jgi:hypothetical protein
MTQTQPEVQPADVAGSLTSKERPSESGSALKQSMVIAGVVIAIIGVIVMGVASNRNEDAQAAVTLGFFGLGVLIAGGALAVTSLVLIAARQVTLSRNAEAEA